MPNPLVIGPETGQMKPLDDGTEWETAGVAGTRRFLDRSWRLVVDVDADGDDTGGLSPRLTDEAIGDKEVERALHAAIKKVSEAIAELRFNTAISEMMVFVNQATAAPRLARAWLDAFVRVLAPFAPHLGEELWRRLGHEGSVAFGANHLQNFRYRIADCRVRRRTTIQLLEELGVIRIVMTNDSHPAKVRPFGSGRVLTVENPCSHDDEDIAATAKIP